jgi:pimeloyl-ACP methyl ester carboxylesterase
MTSHIEPAGIRWTSEDGLDLFARDYGPAAASGIPVICIPGLTRNSLDYEDVAPWLAARGRRTLAVDLRGRGRSASGDPARYRLPVYAADIVALADKLGIERFYILGTSLGGMVAMQMARTHLHRLAGAVLNDIGPTIEKAGIVRISGYASSAPAVTDWAGAVAYARHIAGDVFPHYTDSDWQRFAARMFVETPEGVLQPTYDPAVAAKAPSWLMPLARFVMWRNFRRLARHRPALVLRGEHSDILSRRTLTRMAACSSSVSAREIPGAGHTPDLSEPDSRTALAGFFDAVE